MPEPIVTKGLCIAIGILWGVLGIGVSFLCGVEGCRETPNPMPPPSFGLLAMDCARTSKRTCVTEIQVYESDTYVKEWAQSFYWRYTDGGGPKPGGSYGASIPEVFSESGWSGTNKVNSGDTYLKVSASSGVDFGYLRYTLTADSRHSVVTCTDQAQISTTIVFANGLYQSTGFFLNPKTFDACL